MNISELLAPGYDELLFDVLDHKHTHYLIKGGRGGGKSSAIPTITLMLMTRPENANVHVIVFRKVANTLKNSVFNEFKKCIGRMGVGHMFTTTVSPMCITYKKTGQQILFAGVDDYQKIKSITPSFGYFGVTWLEECDAFKGMEEIRSVLQSTMRGGDRFWSFYSFNPPRSRDNFMNKQILEIEQKPKEYADWMVRTYTYTDMPDDWLGEQFIFEAERLRETNPTAYEHEYLGVATGTGGNVFENVTTENPDGTPIKITDEEISAFDRCYYGIDWGWYPDPFHFCECYFHAASRKLYIYGEIRANKRSNELLSEDLDDWMNCRITADSGGEGPKSIADFRSRGFDMRGAIKGPGSVEYSMKWLASLTEIIIDPQRCPDTAEEFLGYEYERDKDGDVISGYPDRDNHAIDAVRYALEEVWKRRGQ